VNGDYIMNTVHIRCSIKVIKSVRREVIK